jgi:quercetin dioxygenase-like cupin family protein
MRRERLEAMNRGWFVGGFVPTALQTPAAEVGVKRYASGEYEPAHHHKIATEVTLILQGRAEMAGSICEAGDIVVLEPGEVADFRALTEVVTVVVKLPSVTGDKYAGGP